MLEKNVSGLILWIYITIPSDEYGGSRILVEDLIEKIGKVGELVEEVRLLSGSRKVQRYVDRYWVAGNIQEDWEE